MALTEKNIRNIFIYALPKFVGYGLSLMTLPILTRLLAPEDFGVVILALLFPTIAVSIITCGVTPATQRYYFEYRSDQKKLNALFFSSQVFLYFFLFLSSVVVFFFKDIISQLTIQNDKYGMAVFVTFITAYLGQIITFYLYIYQNMEKATVHSVFTLTQAVLTAGASLLFVWYFKMSYMGLIYGPFVGGLTVCLVLLFYFNKNVKAIFSMKILGENIKYGLQVVTKSFTSFVNRFFDKYMLNNMLSLSAVGTYSIGQNIGTSMFYLMNTVWSSFQPVYYREVFDKGQDASASVGRIFTIFSYIALFPLLLLILFAQELVHLIAPPSYYEAINIIIIISAGIATQVFGIYVGVQYAYSKKAFLIFPISVVGSLANVVVNILLIPRLGLVGAGISTVITYFIINGLLTFIGQKLYRIGYEWKTILMILGVVIGATVSILFLKGIVCYSLSLYLMKLGFIGLFIWTGIKAKIVTRDSIRTVISALTRQRRYGR